MFDTICTVPLLSDVFAQAIHPSEPVFLIGLSSGHVHAFKLPAETDALDDDSVDSPASSLKINDAVDGSANGLITSSLRRSSTTSLSESGLGAIDTVWKTRRHKGSCRSVAFNHDGQLGYSAGSDGLVKVFSTETGRVVSKIVIPQSADAEDDDGPTVLHALSPQALLLATDSGRLCLQDLRQGGEHIVSKASKVWTPHGAEHVNALIPLPAGETSTSGFPKQWVSVGGTTLAVTDLRKGTVAVSEDQEVELTSVALVRDLKKGGTSVGEKLVVGQGDGVLSLWERGVWGDLDERIVVDRAGTGIESLVEVPLEAALGKLKLNEKLVAAGLDDGRIRFSRIGRNGVIADLDLKHDEIDGAIGLGFDVAGRMISGGGNVIKVWTEAKGLPGGGRSGTAKHDLSSDDEIQDSDEGDDSDDDERSTARKKRKRNKGKDKSGGKALDFSL